MMVADSLVNKIYSSNISSRQKDLLKKLVDFQDIELNDTIDFITSCKNPKSLMIKSLYQKTLLDYDKKRNSDFMDELKYSILKIIYNNEYT